MNEKKTIDEQREKNNMAIDNRITINAIDREVTINGDNCKDDNR